MNLHSEIPGRGRTVTKAQSQEAWHNFRKMLVASELTLGLKRVSGQMAMKCHRKTHLERFHGSTGDVVGQKPLILEDYTRVGLMFTHIWGWKRRKNSELDIGDKDLAPYYRI